MADSVQKGKGAGKKQQSFAAPGLPDRNLYNDTDAGILHPAIGSKKDGVGEQGAGRWVYFVFNLLKIK